MVRGWVYVISNKAMPKLVKIGYSERDPINRATELGAGTEVPFRYEVIYDALVYSPYKVEQHVHRNLVDLRAGKEWFECDWIAAVNAVRSVAADLNELLVEKEYDILIEYRRKLARAEQKLREREAREKEIREREIREKAVRDHSLKRKQTAQAQAQAEAMDTTRIVVCPKCHSTVKTSGKPPPYFCVACGNNFNTGL
jgi:rubrerythrin